MPQTQKKAWYLANTTVRNALRLKDGLRVLVDSPLHGNLMGREREQQFAILLHTSGVVFVKRFQDGDFNNDATDVGRKWRSALTKMGFISPAFDKKPHTVTPNGSRLIASTTVPEEQECFLRALIALQLPSPIDRFLRVPPFQPFRLILDIIAGLENDGLDAWLTQEEMAFIVQFVTTNGDIEKAVHQIANFRERVREDDSYATQFRAIVVNEATGQNEDTIYTYGDANFRYSKATGLFADGKRLRFSEYKRTIVTQILTTPIALVAGDDQYLDLLWSGASLPTDNADKAIEAIKTTSAIIENKAKGETVEGLVQLSLLPDLTQIAEAELSRLRLKLDDDLLKLLERDFAAQQREQWEEILKYLRELMKPNPDRRLIPPSEAPAYFEWTLWRAFLAIDSLVNKPWEARRFKIDQEFEPVNIAPGGGPDMQFEFEDFVLVVEVTLTTSSRQEAAEGEPVRRHVADQVVKYQLLGKKVYGLFIANKIDTNTAETFRIGSWYLPDDKRLELQIVPLTLRQFSNLFEASFQYSTEMDYRLLGSIIEACTAKKNDVSAPEWKKYIEQHMLTLTKKQ